MADDQEGRAKPPTAEADDSSNPKIRQKSGAQVFVADGTGGMRPVKDLRFEEDEWPIELEVPSNKVDAWMRCLHAEVEARGWNASAFSQLAALENSGTISVHTTVGPAPPGVDIIWERLRDAGLHLRARASGDPPLPLDDAGRFLARVSERLESGETDRAHRRELLAYHGLAWRGELWLGSDLRIGPPSRHPEALTGPQVLVVDAMIDGIGWQGITSNLEARVHELKIFLSFVLGMNLTLVRWHQDWVPDVDSDGRITDCTLRSVGYSELSAVSGFPEVGSAPPVERRDVSRPGLGIPGVWPDMQERVPSDIEELWTMFMKLSGEKRDQLMRAGNAYLIAGTMWPDQRTAYATFLVVACEALKPPGKRHEKMKVYDVVEMLIGASEADRLRKLSVHPQGVRNKHVHRADLAAGELGPMLLHDYFMDPSFDEMLDELSMITRVCLIEWLRHEGI